MRRPKVIAPLHSATDRRRPQLRHRGCKRRSKDAAADAKFSRKNNPRGRKKEKERRKRSEGRGSGRSFFIPTAHARLPGRRGGRNCTRPLRRQKYEAERPAYRQGPLFLFPCRAGRAYESASLQPSRPSWISLVSCATDPRTTSTAPAARIETAKGHRDTGNELQSADRLLLTRSFGHTECRAASKEPLALPRGKLTADFEEGAARAEDRRTEEEFAPPARPAPARWRTDQTQCASKTRKNALGISRKRGGDTVHLD